MAYNSELNRINSIVKCEGVFTYGIGYDQGESPAVNH